MAISKTLETSGHHVSITYWDVHSLHPGTSEAATKQPGLQACSSPKSLVNFDLWG